MATTSTFSANIRVRLRPEDKRQIRAAAELAAQGSGRRGDVSDFVRVAALAAAARLLAKMPAKE